MISATRISAVLLQEYYISYRSIEVIFDIFIFSLIQLLLFGFISLYLSSGRNDRAAEFLLLGMLLWEIVRVIQYSVSVGSLWNIWSRNLSNMFIAPLSIVEYIVAHTLSGIMKAIIVFCINAAVTNWVFHYNIFHLGPMLLVYALGVGIFAFSAGVAILAAIFRFGTRIQAFAWGFLPMLQPLTAAFFPVHILPSPLQYIARAIPSTYFFEAARYQISTGYIAWDQLEIGMGINMIYVIGSIMWFLWMFRASRDSGQFSRNES